MCRVQYAIARLSARLELEAVAAEVVVVVVVVVAGFVPAVARVMPEPTAAVAAVVMPANASTSPQASM